MRILEKEVLSSFIPYFNSKDRTGVWLFGERIVRIFSGLFVSIFFARELGVDNFGFLSFSIAFMLLLSPITSMSIQAFITKEIVEKPKEESRIIGTVLVLQLFLSFIVVTCAVFYFKATYENSLIVFFWIQLMLLFKTFEIIISAFEARSKMKLIAKHQILTILIFFIIKLVLVNYGVGLDVIAFTLMLESLFCAVIFLWLYSKYCGKIMLLSYSCDLSKHYLKKSTPLILSSFATLGYMKVDQIMISHLLSNHDNGIYSVAVRISEFAVFVPQIIMILTFPRLIKIRKSDSLEYIKMIGSILKSLHLIGLSLACLLFLLSDLIVSSLFGYDYQQAAVVLRVHIFGMLFVFMGFVSNYLYIIEGKERDLMLRAVLGLVLNLILNYFFLIKYGIVGAAISTVITQIAVSFLYEIILKDMRWLFYIKLKSLIFKI